MNLRILLALLLLTLTSARSETLTPAALAKIAFEQKNGAQISRNLSFRDETGKAVTLGDYFGRKPVLLVLGYSGCPMLCTIVLNGMVESLQDLRPSIGDQFEVINLSIDPRETPMVAAQQKRIYLKRYGRRGAAEGWHFLTGEAAPISRLAEEVGFKYAYDSGAKQFAHPSGFVILTPEGKVSRYFFGAQFIPKEVAAAIAAAGANKTGSPVSQVFSLGFPFSPLTGKYSGLVVSLIRLCGIATLATLGLLFFGSMRRGDGGKQDTNGAPP